MTVVYAIICMYIFALNVLTFSSNSLFSSFSCRDFIANSSSSFLKNVHQNFVNSQYQCAHKLTNKFRNKNPFFFVVNNFLFLREQLHGPQHGSSLFETDKTIFR